MLYLFSLEPDEYGDNHILLCFVENRCNLPTKGKIFIWLICNSLLVVVAASGHMKVGQKHRQCIFLPQCADDHCLFTVFECRQIDAWVFFNTARVSFSTSTSNCKFRTCSRSACISSDCGHGSSGGNGFLGILFLFAIRVTIPYFKYFLRLVYMLIRLYPISLDTYSTFSPS